MKNSEVANLLYEFADILDMQGVDWKPAAYRKAARSIESLSENIEMIYKEKGIMGLQEISGVGEGIAKKIIEYLETGEIAELEKIKKNMPNQLGEIISIQGMGPKKAKKLYNLLKIDTLKKLEEAALNQKIRSLEGFGTKSEKDILLGISLFKKGKERILLSDALNIAEPIVKELNTLNGVRAEIAGSIRRRKETVRDIDILVVSHKSKEVMDFFTSLKGVKTVLAKGNTKSSIVLKEGIQCDLRIVEEKSYGTALNYFTGSKDHNIALRQLALKKEWSLSEYGLFTLKSKKYITGRTEEGLYKKLGMHYIEPELRENAGEIGASLRGKLPNLISYKDMRGDLHMHTAWSDGVNSLEEMTKKAIALEYDYIAITEHSKSTTIAHGLDEKQLVKRLEEIDKIKKKFPQITIFKGSEVDILKEGSLDYKNNILNQLDFVIGSVHSHFKMSEKEMTQRLLKAIESGKLNALGHPTGRLLNRRDPYEFDMDKVFEKAKDNGVALEINANPHRLDLKDLHIRKGKEFKVKFVINTDSHSIHHLDFMHFGVAQARRGWLEKTDVLNTLPLKQFQKEII